MILAAASFFLITFNISVVYSAYCGILFANLCVPHPDSWNKGFDLSGKIKCKNAKDHKTEVLIKLAYAFWIFLIIAVTFDFTFEVVSLVFAKCWKLHKKAWKRYSTWMNMSSDIAIIITLSYLGKTAQLYHVCICITLSQVTLQNFGEGTWSFTDGSITLRALRASWCGWG